MIYGVTRITRTIVGRVERGELVHDALIELCEREKIQNAQVRGLGAFELAEVVEYDQRRKGWKPSQTFECAMEVLGLVGNVSLKDQAPFAHLHAALSRERDDQERRIECLGGHLLRARAFALELSIDVYDELTLERVPDDATGLLLWCPSDQTIRSA